MIDGRTCFYNQTDSIFIFPNLSIFTTDKNRLPTHHILALELTNLYKILTGVFSLYGTHDALSALLSYLNSLMGSMETSAVLNFGREDMFFTKKFLLGEV